MEIPKERKQDLYAKIVDILSVSHLLIDSISGSMTSVSQNDRFIESIVTSMLDRPEKMMDLLKYSVVKEVLANTSPETLFRANNFTTKLMKFCTQRIGKTYLKRVLSSFIEKICRNPRKFEVDPDKVPVGESVETNSNNVIKIIDDFLTYFIGTADELLPEFRKYCQIVSEEVESKFHGLKDDLLEPKHLAVGGFLFLRVLCPAIVDPVKHGLWEEKMPPEANRFLLLISKILQNLANGTFVPVKETFMSCFATLTKNWIGPIRKFFDKISQPSLTPSRVSRSDFEYTFGELYRARDIIYEQLSEKLDVFRDTLDSTSYEKLKILSTLVQDAGARPVLYPPVFIDSYEPGENDIAKFARKLHILLSRTYLQLIENFYERLEKPIVRYIFNSYVPVSKVDATHELIEKRTQRVIHEIVELLESYYQVFKNSFLDRQVVNHFFETIAFLMDDFIANKLMTHHESILEVKMSLSYIEIWYDVKEIKSYRETEQVCLKKVFAHSRQCMNVLFISPYELMKDATLTKGICPLITHTRLTYILRDVIPQYKDAGMKPYQGDPTKLHFQTVVDLVNFSDSASGKMISKPLFDLGLNAQRASILNKIAIPGRYLRKELEFLTQNFYIRLRRDMVIVHEEKLLEGVMTPSSNQLVPETPTDPPFDPLTPRSPR